MKKESIFYILIVLLMFFMLGCGGGPGKSEASYVGCYQKGTVPSSSATPVPAHSLNANTFGGYYSGGQGDMSPSCYSGRYEPSCVDAYNNCIKSCNSCKASCNYDQTCINQRCSCSCPFNCPTYTPGANTPASVGPSVEISGFGWVWGDLPQCSSNKYERATIYDGDAKQEACACISESYWDGSGSSGKTCCGDDHLVPNNPPAENPDDPDISENFCLNCKLGNNVGSRVWESSVNKCCGDDNFGNGNDNTDEPDWGEKSCNDCLVGNNQGSRVWSAAGCCGDDNEDCATQASGKICSMDSEFKSPVIYSSKDEKGDIKYVPCKDREFLADGNSWLQCDGTFTKTTVNGHDYLCTKNGKESIYECCGDSLSSCNSDKTDGVRLTTGQSIRLIILPSPPVEPPELEQQPTPPEDYGIFVTNCVDDPFFVTNCENLKIGWSSSGSLGYGVDYHDVYISHDGGSSFSYLLSTSNVIVQTTVGFGMTKCFKVQAHGNGPFVGFGPFSEIACGSTPSQAQTPQERPSQPTGSQDTESEESLKQSSPNPLTKLVEKLKGTTITGAVVKNNLQAITGRVVGDIYQSQIADTETTFYCASDKTFTTDLDIKDESTCTKAGFKWTGTKCCSEDDDNITTSVFGEKEFYNDAGGIGGCWNSTLVASVNLVKGTNDSVINYNGEFNGCVIEEANYNGNNNDLLLLTDKHTEANLINNRGYCFNAFNNSYYCSYTEKWIVTDGLNRTHLSFAPINQTKQAAECCAQTECWNGETCIANQREKPTEQPIVDASGNSFRCIDGSWTSSILKFTPDGVPGFCPTQMQCLIDPFGKNESTQCINSTQYVNDNYCEDGKWATRTKLLALELSEFINGDYTLFCDSLNNTLNTLKYFTSSKELASDSLAKFQPNNFCVLISGGSVVSAVSINKELEGVPSKSLAALGIKNCKDGLIDDGKYHPCDSSSKVWYNKRLKSIIHSNDAITALSNREQMSAFNEFIVGSTDTIISSIKSLIPEPPFDESYLNISKRLSRLYASSQHGKEIIGTIEGTIPQNAVVGYTNFEANICSFVQQFNEIKSDPDSGVVCVSEGSNNYVLAQGFKHTNVNPEVIWQDLTSKLRTK